MPSWEFRFNASYKPNEDGCWIWQGHTASRRYGALYVNGKLEQAHRASWMLHHGLIPDGQCVLHKCDIEECVNPHHLFLGTARDNTVDMVRKGRHRGNRKLTPEQVIEIRSRKESSTVLGQHYKISGAQLRDIKTRRSWKNI